MDKKRFLALLLSINISLTLVGCSAPVDTNEKDYSHSQIEVVDDRLADIETDLDLIFDEPLFIKARPYEYVIDYRYLNDEYDPERVKLSKVAFEKDYSTKGKHLDNEEAHFFRNNCLRRLQIKEKDENLYQEMYNLLKENKIDIDMNAKKIINNEDGIYLIDAVVTFNEDVDYMKKGETIEQKYILSSEDELIAYSLDAFGEHEDIGSVNDAILNIDLLDMESQTITYDDIPVIEEYLYFNIDKLKKSKRL